MAFTKEKAKDLLRIARQTRGEMTAEDLASEALLVANYYAIKQGINFDWGDPEDQDLILSKLYTKYVTRRKDERRLTLSSDQEQEDNDGDATALIDFLTAEETGDPLELLERREEKEKYKSLVEEEEAILESYSQSVAYTIVLWHFNNIRTKVAAYLAIAQSTLANRIEVAAKSLKVQSSLFDRIEKISESFMPPRGLSYEVREEQHLGGQQLGWDFALPEEKHHSLQV